MAGKGGARPGAGRPRNSERHAEAIASFTDLAARGLSQCFDNLCTLADGGYERTETKYQPAGTITRKDVLRDKDGEPVRDKNGRAMLVEVLAYPDLPADHMVVVEKKVITTAPDFRANEYLVNRVLGLPHRAAEEEAEVLEIRSALVTALESLAARKARPPKEPTATPEEPSVPDPGPADDDDADEPD